MSVKRLLKNEIKVTGPSLPTNIVKQRINLLAADNDGVTLKDKQSVKFESLKKDDLLETLVLGGRVYSKVVELKKDL